MLAILLTSFALLCTAHVGLTLGLLARTPRWRGLVAFLLPPLAPYWAYESGLRKEAAVWVIAAFVYGVALIAGSL